MTHLGLDAVQLLPLRLDQDRHVQEDLVELPQRLLQLLDGLVPLLDLCQGVEDLTDRQQVRGCEAPMSTNGAQGSSIQEQRRLFCRAKDE